MITDTSILRLPDRMPVVAGTGVLERSDAGGVRKGDGVDIINVPVKRGRAPVLVTSSGDAVLRRGQPFHALAALIVSLPENRRGRRAQRPRNHG